MATVSAEHSQDGRLAVCQFRPELLDKAANLQRIEDMAQRAALAGALLAVFPEYCLTGPVFGDELLQAAEVVHGPAKGSSIREFERIAASYQVQLVVGLAELSEAGVANAAVLVHPGNGAVASYHKVHLWKSEKGVGTGSGVRPGSEFPVFDSVVGPFGILICFDAEFPEAARLLALQGARVMVVPTANMKPWQEFQRVFARARAMENHMHVAIANTTGAFASGDFFGGSIITDPYGRVLAEAGDAEALVVADIPTRVSDQARADLDYLGQRRPALYGGLVR